MEIIWHIEDGYVGKDRPQMSEIDEEDLISILDNNPSDDEIIDALYEIIEEEFNNTISFSIGGQKELVEKVRGYMAREEFE